MLIYLWGQEKWLFWFCRSVGFECRGKSKCAIVGGQLFKKCAVGKK